MWREKNCVYFNNSVVEFICVESVFGKWDSQLEKVLRIFKQQMKKKNRSHLRSVCAYVFIKIEGKVRTAKTPETPKT